MRRRAVGFQAMMAGLLAGVLGSMLAAPLGMPALGQGIPAAAGTEAPARVGRLARIVGTVSFHPDGAERWEAAAANDPIADGAAFWTEPGAQAEIEIGASRVVMDASTEFDITALQAKALTATLPQGKIFLRARGVAVGENLTILTPRGAVQIRADGRYGIFAGDMDNATRVSVLEGSARVSGPNLSLDLAAGQSGLIEGTDDFAGRIAPRQDDSFLAAQAARDVPRGTSAPGPAPAAIASANTAAAPASGQARPLNIVLPPPRDTTPLRPSSPGPILFKPIPGRGGLPPLAVPAHPQAR